MSYFKKMTKTYQFCSSAYVLLAALLLQLSIVSSCVAGGVNQNGDKVFKFGIAETNIRNATKEEVEVAFSHMFNEVAKKNNINMNINIKAYQNTKLLEEAIKNNEVQGVFGNTLNILDNLAYINQDRIFTFQLSQSVKDRFLLLVRKDSQIKTLSDLKNKKLAYSVGDDLGIIYLNKIIKEKELGPSSKFFSIITQKNYSAVTTNTVFFKESDAALVLQSDYEIASELNPQLKQKLLAIETSPEYIVNVIAYRKSLSEEDFLKLNALLNEAIKNKNAQKLFSLFRVTALNKVDTQSIEDIKKLVNWPSPERKY